MGTNLVMAIDRPRRFYHNVAVFVISVVVVVVVVLVVLVVVVIVIVIYVVEYPSFCCHRHCFHRQSRSRRV